MARGWTRTAAAERRIHPREEMRDDDHDPRPGRQGPRHRSRRLTNRSSHEHAPDRPRGRRLALGPERLRRESGMKIRSTARAGAGIRIDGNGAP
jgi:hypothetical protein